MCFGTIPTIKTVKQIYTKQGRQNMKAKKADNIYYLRVDRGEYVIDSIKKICLMYDIKTASISGIGATDKFRCGVYNVNTKQYSETEFCGVYEILSLCGNITRFDGEPYIHAHICASDENGVVVGGHLKEARISATCEMIITAANTSIGRIPDKATGLNILDL